MNELKGQLPFRLGTTSYIIPDDILPNVRWLAGQVDDVELVLFESDQISNIPSVGDIRELAVIAADNDLTYTVHLPLDTALGHADESVRVGSVEACQRIIDRTLPLQPFAYIIHFHGDVRGAVPSQDLNRWLAQIDRSMAALTKLAHSGLFCVETIDYPFSLVYPVVERWSLSVCLDVGHVHLLQYDLHSYLCQFGPLARVFHLHGVRDGADHASLQHLPPQTLDDALQSASSPDTDHVATIEVFSEADFATSLQAIRRWELAWQSH